MNTKYNRKAIWSFIFSIATLALPLVALDLNLLFNFGVLQVKYSALSGSASFALQAIAALVLSVITLYLASNAKKEIRISGERGIVLAHFAFVVGLLGLVYAAVNILDAVLTSGISDVHTTPSQIPKY